MSIIRRLVAESDTRKHTMVAQLVIALYDKAYKEKRHFYFITCTKGSELVKGLKEYSVINKIFKSSINNRNSLFHWDTLSTCDYFEDNSLILCGYMNTEQLEIIDDKILVDAEMYVVEHTKDYCKDWFDRWNNDYTKGNLWSDDFPETIYKGLSNLTGSINGRYLHALDDEQIKTAIRVIHNCVPNASLNEIKNVLLKDFHWDLKDAKQFVSRLKGLREGRYFQGGDKTGLKKKYEDWKAL